VANDYLAKLSKKRKDRVFIRLTVVNEAGNIKEWRVLRGANNVKDTLRENHYQSGERYMDRGVRNGGAFDSAKNHKRQRRKRQSVTAKQEKSQTPKFV